MNPISMMKFKSLIEKFKNNHPKVPLFFDALSKNIAEDSVLELTLTTAEGKKICSNIKVSKDDLELISMIKEQIKYNS